MNMMKAGSNIFGRGGTWVVAGMIVLTGIRLAPAECPPDCISEGRMTGGGVMRTLNEASGQEVEVSHAFVLHCDSHTARNNIEVNWDNQQQFHLESLAFAGCEALGTVIPGPPQASFDRLTASGYGRLNDTSGAFIFVLFTDAGGPGRNDTSTIVIYDSNGDLVLNVTAHLESGNHRAYDGLPPIRKDTDVEENPR
jgi:hypothetical protein